MRADQMHIITTEATEEFNKALPALQAAEEVNKAKSLIYLLTTVDYSGAKVNKAEFNLLTNDFKLFMKFNHYGEQLSFKVEQRSPFNMHKMRG